MQGATEVIAYGTAVQVERAAQRCNREIQGVAAARRSGRLCRFASF
jgi:hypothetical protein